MSFLSRRAFCSLHFALCTLILLPFFLPKNTFAQVAPVISSSNPPSGYIDPLEDYDTVSGTALGLKDITITFSKTVTAVGGGALASANFQRRVFKNGIDTVDLSTQQLPSISLISGSGAGPYLLRFSPRIALGAWTEIKVVNVVDSGGVAISSTGNRVVYGFLPMDISQDGRVFGDDIARWLLINSDEFNPAPLTKLLLCDQSRNNVVAGEDIARAMQLVSGVGTHQIWSSYDLGPSTISATSCTNGIQDGNEQGVDCGTGCPYGCPTSNILGIDITLNGTPGKDYAVENSYFDSKVFDEKVIYIKDSVSIGFKHNQFNRKQSDLEGYSTLIGINGNNGNADPATSVCLNNFPNNLSQCDAGLIRYKVDRDEQLLRYVRPDMTEVDNGGRTPYFTAPLTFNTLTYQPEGFAVVGKTGNNGQPYYNNVEYGGARPKYGHQGVAVRTNYGLLDQYGDEYHTITVWDDDSAWNTGYALGASDGLIFHFVVNPKTPAIRFEANTPQAQFYTTPHKTYFIPKIFPQTTYLTRDVRIILANVTNTAPLWYRVGNGSWQQYTTPLLSQSILTAGVTTAFQYVFQQNNPQNGITGVVKSRPIVLDPAYPSAIEQHPYNFLWDSPQRLAELRADYLDFEDTDPVTAGDIFNGFRFKTYETPRTIAAAKNSFLSGSYGLGAKAAKRMLLDAPWMHETVALEMRGNVDASTPNRFALFYYQGNANEILDGILAYDLLIKDFKTTAGYADGISAIEDYLIRDRFAAAAKNTLQFISAHEQYYSTYDPQGGTGTQHYALSAEIATAVISMALPTYNTMYFGTSGYGGQAATYPWTPFPNHPRTWWFSVTDETNPSLLHNNPDRSTVSHLNIWMLAKNGILGTPKLDYYSTYYGLNMERVIPLFSNIIHNANAPLDLTQFDWKIGDYMLCKKYNRCADGGGYIYDPRDSYRSTWHINHFYSFAGELLNYLGGPSSVSNTGTYGEFLYDPTSLP